MARTVHARDDVGHRPLPIADLDHGLATATIVLGALGLLLVAFGVAGPGAYVGLLGVVVGLCAQMLSRTRGERFADMAGLLACFIAFAAGASQGGLS